VSEGITLRGRLIALSAIVSAIVLGLVVLVMVYQRPRTHDARLFAYSAALATEVSGRIVNVYVVNDQLVSKGDALIRIDPVPFEWRLQQARAQVDALKAQIALTGRQVTSQESAADAAFRQVERARQQLALAQATLGRLEPMVEPGYVTRQALDEARTNERTSQAALEAAIKSANEAREAVGDTDSLRSQLLGAQAGEALAARDLDLTTLRAPFTGRVVGLQLAEGSYAAAGHPLFSMIKSDTWYAIADFRETELPYIAVGDRATVWTMAQSNVAITGHVESLGAGVQSTDQDGPGLPVLGRDLNWVVVAQRFPVWIRLDGPPEKAMHVGLTASVKVTHGSRH
jgi:multidrug efflux system membrane fusion protein